MFMHSGLLCQLTMRVSCGKDDRRLAGAYRLGRFVRLIALAEPRIYNSCFKTDGRSTRIQKRPAEEANERGGEW